MPPLSSSQSKHQLFCRISALICLSFLILNNKKNFTTRCAASLFSFVDAFRVSDIGSDGSDHPILLKSQTKHNNHHQYQTITTKKNWKMMMSMTDRKGTDDDDCIDVQPTTASSSSTTSTITNNDRETLQPIHAGFIGFGTIASSIAHALASPSHSQYLADIAGMRLHFISVTKRSESKSSSLKRSFPDIVTIYNSPVDVVANSNIVFLCVLPQQVDGVLYDLRKANVWKKDDHTLVTLVSTSNIEDLILRSNLQQNRVYKVICLPSIANREGCALLQRVASNSKNVDDTNNTNNPNTNTNSIDVKAMFTALGGCVECPNDSIMNTMMITTCMMGPLYGVMKTNRDWLVQHGVDPKDASYFVGRSYLSMVQDAERRCQDLPNALDALIQEQTPGGLNEQSLQNLYQQQVFQSYNRVMDALLLRLQGHSDGSLPS